jgi:phosphoribosyl 1,2-cyclic phosphate phosphodiesterase
MKITLLGTGDAGGAPRYGCDCPACARARADPAFRRDPCSAIVQSADACVLIDAGLADLADQIARTDLSAILLTHFHPDHVLGLFRLRWGNGRSIPVYAPPDRRGCGDLYKNPGILEFRPLRKFQPVRIAGLSITPLPMIHSKPTFGYAVESASGARFAYLTDTIGLPQRTTDFVKNWRPDAVALDCTHAPQYARPRNHNDLTRALEIAKALTPTPVWLTHVGHELDAWLLENAFALPPGVSLARDGVVVVDRP